MIRISFLVISLISLIYGCVFLFIPNWFINFSDADITNIAWLRNIGASIVGLLFIGCLNIYCYPRGKLTFLKIINITSILQTLTLIFSRFYNEFSAKKLLVIDFTIYIAIFVCIYFTWIIMFKSHNFK